DDHRYSVFFAFPQGQPPAIGACPLAAAAAAASLHAAAPQQPPPGMHPPGCSPGFASVAGAADCAAAGGGRRSSSAIATALVPNTSAVKTTASHVRFIDPPRAFRRARRPFCQTGPVCQPSGLQQRSAPAAACAHEELALVQAVVAVTPELDRVGDQPESPPVGWTRHPLAGVTAIELSPPGEERRPGGQPGALRRGQRREPALARPGLPVAV